MATDLTWERVSRENWPQEPEKFFQIARYGTSLTQGGVTTWTNIGVLLDTSVTPHQFWRILTTGYGEDADVRWHAAKYPV